MPTNVPTNLPSTTTENRQHNNNRQGFVNFFGEQRFGRDGTNNVDVGLLLLCSKWKLACDRIMAPHRADSPRLAEIKKLFLSGARLGQMLRYGCVGTRGRRGVRCVRVGGSDGGDGGGGGGVRLWCDVM